MNFIVRNSSFTDLQLSCFQFNLKIISFDYPLSQEVVKGMELIINYLNLIIVEPNMNILKIKFVSASILAFTIKI